MRRDSVMQFRIEKCLADKFKAVVASQGDNATSILIAGILRFIRKTDPGCMHALKKALRMARKNNLRRGRKTKEKTCSH